MFVRGGATFANMARLSAAGIPVISIVHGSSTAGGAYQTGLADYVVMVRGRSKVFLAGPPLLRAATGEVAGDEALGGAELHCAVTGLGEYLAEDDADALRIGREILARIGWGQPTPRPRAPAPLYDPEELLGIVPVDYRKPYEVREVIARLVDGSEFLDFKPLYGAATVCGHAAIEGRPVGLLGNNGPIDSAGSSKAGQFIQLCSQAGLPIVFLQNTTGYLVGVDAETSGIVKHGSKMIQAVTNAAVPKLTLQIGGSFGAGHYGMCGRAFGPRFLFSWPNARVAVMGGEQAAKVMAIVAEEGARGRGTPFRRREGESARGADRRQLRSRSRPRSSPPRGSGTTASSIRATAARRSPSVSIPARRRKRGGSAPTASASRGFEAMASLLHVRQAGRRLTIVLDDPRRQNALSAEMVGEIEGALDAAPPGLAALVIEGANGVFSAGADLKSLSAALEKSPRAGRARSP